MSVTIRKVESSRDRRKFVKFPLELYKDCPYYNPGLYLDEIKTLTPSKNPSSEFCDSALFLAYKNDKIVGRVAAIINRRANEQWSHAEVRYGWLDFIDDREVSKALIDAVIEYGRQAGMNRIQGPLGFTDADSEGLVVEGFNQLPTFPLRYNHPYYMEHLEALGMTKVVDWLEFQITIPKEIPERLQKISDMVKERYNLHVRKVTRREVRREQIGRKIFDLINRTYCDLFDFTILPDKVIDHYVDIYLGLLDLKFITLIEDEGGKLIAFGITMPSIVRAVKKCNGYLFPFGWFHILKSMFFKYEENLELLLIAVDPEYRNKGVNAMLFCDFIPFAAKCGFKYAETNAELEDNQNVQSPWAMFEHKQHRRRRVYGKDI
jgi:GNAT superfamily N-acetyltransferase